MINQKSFTFKFNDIQNEYNFFVNEGLITNDIDGKIEDIRSVNENENFFL